MWDHLKPPFKGCRGRGGKGGKEGGTERGMDGTGAQLDVFAGGDGPTRHSGGVCRYLHPAPGGQ